MRVPRNCNMLAMAAKSNKDRAIALAQEQGVGRARDFEAQGIPRMTLRRLVEEGALTQPSRGLYQLANAEHSAEHSLAEAAKAAPSGVVALLSALQFRPHDEEPLSIAWTLGIHSSTAIPYPTIQQEDHRLRPFFLFIPPDASPEQLSVLLEALQVNEPGVRP